MEPDWNSSLKEINGINLNNYVPQKRSFNSVEFIHKKYFDSFKPVEEKKERVKPKKVKKNKLDKGQQFNCDQNERRDNTIKFLSNNDDVLDQTIKFAKNIVPLVMPSENKSQVFYTIKTHKKHKTKDKKSMESNMAFGHRASTHEREDPKKVVEKYKKIKKESISVKESISHSDNTLDDLNINQSISCTFSEVSEKKYHKKEKSHTKKSSKIAVSESFEAVATEAAPGDGQIKIHLMNEKEKHFLSDTIKEPVLNAIKECLADLNNYNLNTDITTVQKIIKCNSDKLDNILDKLTCIENKLDSHEKKLNIQGKKFEAYEKKLDAQEAKLESQASKLESQESKLDSQESKLNSQTKKLDVQERILETHEKKFDTYKKEMSTTINKPTTVTSDDKKVSQPKVPVIKPKSKASMLEDLGEDLIDIEEEYTSEEELHQELLDRRSKSTVVVELEENNKGDKKMEALGGGEVPRGSSAKGTASIGATLERPNRLPARFCWTDAARKN